MVKYGTQQRLNEILSKGHLGPFPRRARTFPEMIPKAGVDPPITAQDIHEEGTTPISEYVHARQFMIFSLAAKTTLESFIPAQTLLAGNPTTNVATIDLTANKDPEGGRAL